MMGSAKRVLTISFFRERISLVLTMAISNEEENGQAKQVLTPRR